MQQTFLYVYIHAKVDENIVSDWKMDSRKKFRNKFIRYLKQDIFNDAGESCLLTLFAGIYRKSKINKRIFWLFD